MDSLSSVSILSELFTTGPLQCLGGMEPPNQVTLQPYLDITGFDTEFFPGGGNFPRNRLFPWIKEQHIHV